MPEQHLRKGTLLAAPGLVTVPMWLQRPACRYAAKFAPAVLGTAFILYANIGLLTAKFPYLLLNADERDQYYPLFTYFIAGLKHGVIDYYHPFLFAGERLLGNPTFQYNPVQLLVGFLFGPSAIFGPINFTFVAEPIVAFLGMYLFIGAICRDLPSYTRAILALTYVFSDGYIVLQVFPMTLQFATFPWILYFLVRAQDQRWTVVLAGLIASFYVQFAYGFLQFSVYVIWLALLFALFWPPWPKKLRAVGLLAVAGPIAALLSFHILLPLIDQLYFAEGHTAARVAQKLVIAPQLVPDFYLVRLFVPTLFSGAVPWWPFHESNWSPLESFSAFQGLPISLLAVFGLFVAAVPRFFRAGYVILIVSVITSFGVVALYVINLGAEVPYGRQTIFLGFMAPVIAGFTLCRISSDWRTARAFSLCCAAFAVVFLAVFLYGFPGSIVEYAFNLVRLAFPNAAYDPAGAAKFLNAYAGAMRAQFAWPFAVASLSALVSTLVYAVLRTRSAEKPSILAATLASVLCLIALGQAYGYTQATGMPAIVRGEVAREKADNRPREVSIQIHHPAEDALIAAGAQTLAGPIKYRTHLDIYFGEQRVGAVQTWRITGARPEENRFRTLTNALAGERIALTTGFVNVNPQSAAFTDMMIPHYGAPFKRAMGERARLHPYILQAFGVRWVLRHQPDVIQSLKGRQDYSDDVWEQRFLASSKLIYSDSTYRLYEYNDARPVFDVPERIALGDNAPDTFTALENVNEPWPVTAVVPEKTLDTLDPAFASRATTEKGIRVIRQSGKIVDSDGEPGRWTKLTVVTEAPALVLTGTKFDPWWQATVNGKPTPLILANGIFEAVPVPAGKSEIVIRLRPYSVWAGTATSAATLVFLMLGFAGYRYRTHLPPRKRPPAA